MILLVILFMVRFLSQDVSPLIVKLASLSCGRALATLVTASNCVLLSITITSSVIILPFLMKQEIRKIKVCSDKYLHIKLKQVILNAYGFYWESIWILPYI